MTTVNCTYTLVGDTAANSSAIELETGQPQQTTIPGGTLRFFQVGGWQVFRFIVHCYRLGTDMQCGCLQAYQSKANGDMQLTVTSPAGNVVAYVNNEIDFSTGQPVFPSLVNCTDAGVCEMYVRATARMSCIAVDAHLVGCARSQK